MRKILTTIAFQQLCEHIYLAKLISSCCFALSRAAANPKGGKTTRRNQFCQINVLAKLLKSDLTFQIDLFDMRVTMSLPTATPA